MDSRSRITKDRSNGTTDDLSNKDRIVNECPLIDFDNHLDLAELNQKRNR